MKRLLGVAVFSGTLTVLRMGLGFLIAKLVAVHTGPAGIALLGQVQNFSAAMAGIVGAPAGNGVVRYTAEHQADGFERCALWWRASMRYLLCLLAPAMMMICLFSDLLSVWLFSDSQWAWVLIVAALTLPLTAANTLFSSVINGLQQYRRFILLGMVSVLAASALMIYLTVAHAIAGALLAAVLFGATSGLVLLIAVWREPWFRRNYWFGAVDRARMRDVAGYIGMAATSAICLPLATILVRNILADWAGWQGAGMWNAVFKVSEAYLGIITLALSTYFMPRLASLPDFAAVRRETFDAARIIFPVAVLLAGLVYFGRDLAISLLFTETFRPARDLFAAQLVGDVFKILSWIFAYPMLAGGATSWYMGTEIGFSIVYVAAAACLIPSYGAQGANMAFTLSYIAYFIFLVANFERIGRRFRRG